MMNYVHWKLNTFWLAITILYSFIYLALTQQPLLRKDMWMPGCMLDIYIEYTREKTEKSVREESK